MSGRINRIKRIVETCLATFPETRDDDRKLILKVWTVFQGITEINEHTAIRLISSESIRRVRQKIQHEEPKKDLGPTSIAVMKQRAKSEQEFREWAI